MKRTPAIVASVVGLAVLIAIGFVAGRISSRSGDRNKTAGRRVIYWVDPMHPAYKSDKPGIAPDCGMALEPVYEGQSDASQASLPPGAVSLSSERQQLIGIRIGTASRSNGFRTVRTTGRVVADENHLYRLLAGADGWIESLGDNPPGTEVKKGQELARMYSPEFRTAEANYLGFISGVVRLRQNMNPNEVKTVEDSAHINEEQLRLFGVGDEQLKKLRETLRSTGIINLVSPGDGLVLNRGITPGQQFQKGAELFRIADLNKVWIVADIYGDDGELKPGTHVRVRIPELGKTIVATVSFNTPLFDEKSRTLKVRLEADNPGLLMRPDMFVDVQFDAKVPPGLSIPAEAILDSGTRKIVYVESSDGVFAPRPIQIAGAYGDLVAVASGISEGDRIVVSGNFLLDSESRMRMAGRASQPDGTPDMQRNDGGSMVPESKSSMHMPAEGALHSPAKVAKLPETVRDPVCGMALKPAEVKFTAIYLGKTFQFCSDSCNKKFLANPEKYASDTAASKVASKGQATESHD